jgi:hypothetical protein
MRRVVRRHRTVDATGMPLSSQSERLVDDGQGLLHVDLQRTAGLCSGCRRPVVELSELRGLCDQCHARSCCAHCLAVCDVCSRRLCGQCRRGFGGPPARTVCESCLRGLIERQAYEDSVARQRERFERDVARARLLYQAESLRLTAERMNLQAQFQSARLGLGKRSLIGWAAHLTGIGIAKAYQNVRRCLR